MKAKLIKKTERIFLRSCLESAPGAVPVRNFSGAGQQPNPTRLDVLKQKLLRTALEQTAAPHLQKQLCGAANMAADMAWDTVCPFLVFPCLFEEMAGKILSRYILDEPIDDAGPCSPEENDPDFGNAGAENGSSRPNSDAETLPPIWVFRFGL